MRKVELSNVYKMTRVVKFRYTYNEKVYHLRLLVLYDPSCSYLTYGYTYTIEKVLGYDNDSELVKSLHRFIELDNSTRMLIEFKLSKKITSKDLKQCKLYFYSSTLSFQYSRIIKIDTVISVDCIDEMYDETKYTINDIFISEQPYLECHPCGFDDVDEDWCDDIRRQVMDGVYNYELVYKALNYFT